MSKRIFLVALLISSLIIGSSFTYGTSTVSAHRSGCHRWHSCPSDTGSYVCGDLGYTSECGDAVAPSKPAPIKRAPVITSKTDTKESVIPYVKKQQRDQKEYTGYSKSIQVGSNGKKLTKVVIHYTDGIESSRDQPVEVVTVAPQDEIIKVGVREKPVARFTKIISMKDGFMNRSKGQFIVQGFYKSNTEVYLNQNGKHIAKTKTNQQGYFEFKNLKKRDKPSWLILYTKNRGKEVQVSEKTRATFSKLELKTEYSLLQH